jgi:hypothetical protein
MLTDRGRSSKWLAGRTPLEIVFNARRDVWTVTSTRSRAKGSRSRLVVSVETEQWFSQCWTVPDIPTAIRAAGAFARDPDADVLDQSDLDAIEAYELNPNSRAFLSIYAASEHELAFVAAMYPRNPDSEPRDLPSAVELRPLDLFDKFGFDEGGVLDAHVQELRAEGWCLGTDELLRAVVEAKVLPLLDPRPQLDCILSLHNNVRGLLEGHEEEFGDQDFDIPVDATAAWPASVTIGTAEILSFGRVIAGPLTGRIRALEAALRE